MVYQEYPREIAEPAVAHQRFIAPSAGRGGRGSSPSCLWMMYRCGWAFKVGQERVLALRITRSGSEEALASACLSHVDAAVFPTHEAWQSRLASSPVRIQWDPERDVALNPLAWRSIQIGPGAPVVPAYVDRWIVGVEDVTARAERLGSQHADARTELPRERPYPLSAELRAAVGASPVEP